MKIEKAKALEALLSLFDRAFGIEKGSNDSYWEWAESQDLCVSVDPDVTDLEPENYPPDIEELLIAAGISPQELLDNTNNEILEGIK